MAEESGAPAGPGEGRELFRFGSREQRFRGLFHSLLLVLAAFAGAIALGSVGISILDSIGITEDGSPALYEALSTAAYFFGMFAVAVWYLDWQDEYDLIGLRWPTKRDVGIVVAGSVGIVALVSAIEFVFTATGVELAENSAVEAGRDNPELYLYYIPIVILFNSPGEELLFRGVVQGQLRRAYGVVPGILGAAAIFGMIHYIALVGAGSQLAYVAVAFASGALLGALYEYAGNIVIPWLVHAAWNVLVYVSLYLEATGGL